MQDVNITQNQLNVGQQLMSLGIVLFEFPSNMALYRVGAARWLTLQLFLLVSVLLSLNWIPSADHFGSMSIFPSPEFPIHWKKTGHDRSTPKEPTPD
jgi:hypothetical protein